VAPTFGRRLASHRDRSLARLSRAPRRGDVFWVALDPARGTEIRLRSRIGTLSAEDLVAVEEALLITLGIGRA